MSNTYIYARLRNVLATLYPESAGIRRVVDDSGLQQGHIHFSDQAINSWHSVIAVANSRGRLETLLTVVEAEYGENAELAAAIEEYRSQVAPRRTEEPVQLRVPFIGPAPFQTGHAKLFHGRQCEIEALTRILTEGNAPLLVVNGLSGVGKTSLLRAGLLPQLQDARFSVAYASILDSPQADTMHGIETAFPDFGIDPFDDIPSAVNALVCPLQRPFILIVDQLERCFTLTRDHEGRRRFWRDIARLVGGEVRCPTKVVLAVRSDWLYAFQDVASTLSVSAFNFLYKLEPLTRKSAGEALVGPLDATGFRYEPALIDLILDDLALGDGTVNPPQLQIVGDALYRHWLNSGNTEERCLTVDAYEDLQGARAIIREHLFRIVKGLGLDAQLGWQILLKLVGRDRMRLSLRAEELQGNVSRDTFDRIVSHLVNNALLVREISTADNAPVYTLTHDCLLEEIDAHVKADPQLQIWRTVERYLRTGLADWRESRDTSGIGLVLGKDRYQYIWSHRDVLDALNAEATTFLAHTALAHGEPSFGYWLDLLPEGDRKRVIEAVAAQAFCSSPDKRSATAQAITKAHSQQLLSESTTTDFKSLFWEAYTSQQALPMPNSAPAIVQASSNSSEPVSERGQITAAPHGRRALRDYLPARLRPTERPSSHVEAGQPADAIPPEAAQPLSRSGRKRVAARLLWALRSTLSLAERAQLTPTISRMWVGDHRHQLVTAVIGGLVVLLAVGIAWRIEQALHGQWHQLPPLYAGPIEAAAIAPGDPDTIYVVTAAGPAVGDGVTLLRGEPGGPWEIVARNIAHQPVRALAVVDTDKGRQFYISLHNGGIIRRSEQETDWSSAHTKLGSYTISNLVADPENSDLFYAGSDQQRGVFESRDGGVTWHDISGPELFGVSIMSMAFSNDDGGALLVGTDDGRILYRLRGESTWAPATVKPGIGRVVSIAAEPVTGKAIYAATSNGMVLVSRDGVLTSADGPKTAWKPIGRLPEIFSIHSVAVAPNEPAIAFINAYGIGGSITWMTSDYGESWQPVPDSTFCREELGLMVHAGAPGRLYAVGTGGFFVSEDKGETWEHLYQLDAQLAPVSKIAVSRVLGGPTYAIVNGAVFYRNAADGGEWRRGRGLPAVVVNDIVADPMDPDKAFTAVHLPNRWSIFVTRDGGRTWVATDKPEDAAEHNFNYTTGLEIAEEDGRRIVYAGTAGCGLLSSRDGGESWRAHSGIDCVVGEGEPEKIVDIAADSFAPATLYVAADHAKIYVSRDGGSTWQTAEPGTAGAINVIKADPNVPGRVYLTAGSGGFWRSDDGALSWQKMSSGLEGHVLVDLVTVESDSGRLYVVAEDGGVWTSANAGRRWTSVRENLPTTHATSIAYDPVSGRLLLSSDRDGLYGYRPGSVWDAWRWKPASP